MSRQENNIENDFIRKLEELGYQYRPDIKDNTTLNQNFRESRILNELNLYSHETLSSWIYLNLISLTCTQSYNT
jgi:hypothetical protein